MPLCHYAACFPRPVDRSKHASIVTDLRRGHHDAVLGRWPSFVPRDKGPSLQRGPPGPPAGEPPTDPTYVYLAVNHGLGAAAVTSLGSVEYAGHPRTDAECDAWNYARLLLVREGAKRTSPTASPEEISRMALSKWYRMSEAAQNKFKGMFTKLEMVGAAETGPFIRTKEPTRDRPLTILAGAVDSDDEEDRGARRLIDIDQHEDDDDDNDADYDAGADQYHAYDHLLDRGGAVEDEDDVVDAEDDGVGDTRKSKYARPKYRAPTDMVRQAKRIKSQILAAVIGVDGAAAAAASTSSQMTPPAAKPGLSHMSTFSKPKSKLKLGDVLASVSAGLYGARIEGGPGVSPVPAGVGAKRPSSRETSTDRPLKVGAVHRVDGAPKEAAASQPAPKKTATAPKPKPKPGVDLLFDTLYTLPGLSDEPAAGALSPEMEVTRRYSFGAPKTYNAAKEPERSILKRAPVKPPADWRTLPAKVWVQILRVLPQKERLAWALTCRQFNALVETPDLWTELTISGGALTVAHLGRVSRLQATRIDLSWSTVSDDTVCLLLQQSPQLEMLSLAGCPDLAQPCLSIGTCKLNSLTTLNLSFQPKINDSSLQQLFGVRGSLLELHLCGAGITDAGVGEVVRALQKLQVLDVYQCRALTDEAFLDLHACTPDLRRLDLRFTGVSNAVLAHVQECKALTEIDVRDCLNVAPKQVLATMFGPGVVVRTDAHTGGKVMPQIT